MNGNFLKIRDLVSLNLADAGTKDNLYPAPTMQQTAKGLLVKIAATHSGIVNRNNMFYLPDKMREGAKTFVTPFQKPILTNHNEEGAPIGRIVAAQYIDTSSYVKDKLRGKVLKDSLSKKNESIGAGEILIDHFCSGQMPYGAQVDFVRSYLNDSILDDPDYTGLGYIEVTAHITDKDAIQKFLDGRYLTSSVGAGTNRASCSVCKQDWTKDGMCDHRPGKVYDGTKCYMIAGEFEYDELSMVNKPADRHAKVMALSYNGALHDAVVEDMEFSGKLYEVRVQFLKEEDMKLKDSETTVENPVVEQVKDQKVEESFDDFITRVLDFDKGDLSIEDDEKLYQLMLAEMKESKLFEDKLITDATLSNEKRKALSKASFCGPNRSFPVPDCAHVVAARRLIGKYKGPGSKDSILSCVARKAAAMGCGTEDQAVVEAPVEQPAMVEAADKLSADEFKTLFTAVVDMAKKKDKTLLSLVEKQLLDEVVSLETQLGKMRDEVTRHSALHTELQNQNASLKQEYDIAVKEAEVLQDEVVKTRASLRASKDKTLVLYKSLKTGTVVEVVDANLADSAVDAEIETLAKEVDIKKITDKLCDGTSRRPQGTVENPSSAQGTIVDATAVKGKLAKIQETYMEMKFKNSILADQYLAKEMAALKAQGLLPKDSE